MRCLLLLVLRVGSRWNVHLCNQLGGHDIDTDNEDLPIAPKFLYDLE